MKYRMTMMNLLVVLATLKLTACSAIAEEGYNAPTLEGEFPWRAIGATALCFGGLLLAGLKNSRRSQQGSK